MGRLAGYGRPLGVLGNKIKTSRPDHALHKFEPSPGPTTHTEDQPGDRYPAKLNFCLLNHRDFSPTWGTTCHMLLPMPRL